MKPYLLIIDIRSLLPKNPPTGIPNYLRELLKAIFEHCQDAIKARKVRIVLFSSGDKKPDLQFLDFYKKRFIHIHLPIPNRILNLSFKIFACPKIDTLFFSSSSHKEREVIFFAPNVNLIPISFATKLVTTFHDLSYERYPHLLNRKEWWWHKIINPHHIAKQSHALIAVSESTKKDLVELYNVNHKKIRVIYSGISKDFSPRGKRGNKKEEYILYLGSMEGRKNVQTLIEAFGIIKMRLKSEALRLILAGPGEIDLSTVNCQMSIVTLGPVCDQKRLELYQHATVFVYPSLFEGFGFPPLEAMASGVPVITSYPSSLPEAVGDAALMVNSHKVHELAQALGLLLTDEKLRNHYIKKGLERVKQFRWEKTAKQTIEVLLN